MEIPKKERRFLKLLGKVGEILVQELLIKVGKSLVQKIGGKKNLPSIIFLFLFYNIAFASIDSIPYPITGNKQRLGWQTTGNGLVWRGNASDTVTKPSNYANKDIKAYLLLDTVNNVLYNYIASKGGWQFSNTDSIIINNNFIQPVDSLFFKTSVPTNNVDTAKMRWDSDLATVVLGMYDQVPNELGFKNFWLVKNQTGSTITKGSIVYANGTVGASGRITVAKFIANGTIEAKYLLGVTAHDLTDGEDGYVISFGKIRQVNTDTFAAGAILYPSPTTAGVWTDVEPIAPNIDMPIGFCINSSSNNGTIAIRVASGYKLSELHDVAISSPVDKASLYYSGGLWKDTTAALLLSDTASMLLPYLRKLDTITLSNRINNKLNISDTTSMLLPYFRDADTSLLNLTSRFGTKLNLSDTASMLTPYFRDADTTSLNLTSRFASKLNLSDTASMLTNYLRTGVAASTYLTQSNAASTYLPLTGGTLTGGLTGTSAIFSGNLAIGYPVAYKPLEVLSNPDNFVSIGVNQLAQYQWSGIHFGYRESNLDYRSSAIVFQRNEIPPFIDATGKIHLLNVSYANGGRSADLRDAKLTISNNGFVGINDTTPSYTLDVNGTFNASGNSLIGGTLGVTGATTLSSPLIVNSSAVFNEGSADADFRVESDGNANMVFVDASTDRVGIGTNAPTKTLDVNGEVKIATTTATPTSLLGKDGSNVVGEVTTVAQTGLMKAGGTTANTSSVGIITVAHGLSYTPSQVIATVAQQNSYVIVCHAKDGTNMSFTVYDSLTGNALNNVSVGFFWLAIK